MKINNITGVNEKIYEKTLENGLKIYIVPNSKIEAVNITLNCKFGAVNKITRVDGEIVEFPNGIMHFLEHKMFAMPNGEDAFKLFGDSGANANAFTSNSQTSYLFTATNKIEENLRLLVNFVFTPFFTDENIKSEVGIIDEEINMYIDEPFEILLNTLRDNTFDKSALKYDILGSHDEIREVTKENLYSAYNTFYNPSNMFFVITGNVDPENIIDIIDDEMKNYNFNESKKIEPVTNNEPMEIVKEEEIIYKQCNINKYGISLKFVDPSLNEGNIKTDTILNLLCSMLFGSSTEINQYLIDKGIISSSLSYYSQSHEDVFNLCVTSECENVIKLKDEIELYLSNYVPSESDFNRYKKVRIANYITCFDDERKVNNFVQNSVSSYGYMCCDYFDIIKSISFSEFKEIFNKIKFDNTATVLMINKDNE